MQAFFHMGGYAIYVWPAYAVFFAVLLVDYLAPAFRRRRILRELRGRMARQKARQTQTAQTTGHDTTPTRTDAGPSRAKP